MPRQSFRIAALNSTIWIARVILRNARAIGSFDFVNATF